MINNVTELNQRITDLRQRFSIPPRFLSKEDNTSLVLFLEDTSRYLYDTIADAIFIKADLLNT